jgi:exonuclease SbcC
MLPKKLTIQGLYSYQNRVEIDFEKLIQAGIFGIFGQVGSGKSSILEAMSFALYGETERLNKGDGLGYNMMNLSSDELFVEYEFLAPDIDETDKIATYIFTVRGKRKKKDFTQVGTFERNVYKLENQQRQPLEIKDAAKQIIGLDYKNFRRSIIIPQGKFEEFLSLGQSDRTRMMREIFSLDKYEFSNRVKFLTDENTKEKAQIQGGISALGFENSEAIKAEITRVELEKKTLDSALKDLIEKQIKNSELLSQAQKLFAEKAQSAKQVEELQTQKQNLKDEIIESEKSLQELDDKHQKLEKELALEDALRLETEELVYLLEIKKIDQDLQKKAALISKEKTSLTEIENKIAEIKKAQSEFDEKIEKLDSNGLNFEETKDLLHLIEKTITLQKDINLKQENLQQLKEEGFALREQMNAQIEKILPELKVSETSEEEILTKLDQALLKAQEELSAAQLEQELNRFKSELKENQACPLCGSTNHPKVQAPQANLGEQVQKFQERKAQLEKLKYSLIEMFGELKSKRTFYATAHKELEALQEKTSEFQLQIEKKPLASLTQTADLADLERLCAQRLLAHKENQKLIEHRNNLLIQLQNISMQRENLQKDSQLINDQILVLEDRKKQFFTKISRDLTDLQKLSMPQIEMKIQEIKEKLEKNKKDFADLQINLKDLNDKKKEREIDLRHIEKALFEQTEILKKIEISLLEMKFTTDAIEEMQKLDMALKEEIDASRENLGQKSHQLLQLKEKAKKFSELNENLKKATLRQGNLEILKKLFGGSGFVRFVSKVYLRDICHKANHRFRKLTKNKLELHVDENCDFHVRDFLNNGHLRLAKTLSGGQRFQASLSLALALSDSVNKLQSSALPNFFFIDEGFGTLDPEGLHSVFATLQSLNREQKIVGIISHVEALKQEIPIYLQVKKDEKDSSQVLIN